MPIRYDVDPGGEWLVPFARKKLGQLKEESRELGVEYALRRRMVQVDANTRVEVSTVSGFDRITIRFAPAVRSGVYHWPSINDTQMLMAVELALSDDEDIGGAVTAEGGLTALNSRLTFSVTENFSGHRFIDAPKIATFERVTGLLEMLVLREDWFAKEMFAYLLARTDYIQFRGVQLPFSITDSLISRPDVDGNFYVMLGKFPAFGKRWVETAGVIEEEDDPAAAGASSLLTQEYSGVVTTWAALLASVVNISSSAWAFDFDDEDPEVTALASYTRLEVGARRASNPGAPEDSFLLIAEVSPFARVYERLDGPSMSVDHPKTWIRHELTSDGEVVEVDAAEDVVRGESSWLLSTHTTPGGSPPPTATGSTSDMTCDMTFFDGERFVKVGEHTYTGGTWTVADIGATVSCLPLFGPAGLGDSTPFRIYAYARTQERVLAATVGEVGVPSGTSLESFVIDTETMPYSYTVGRSMNLHMLDTNPGWVHVYTLQGFTYHITMTQPPPWADFDYDYRISGFGQGTIIGRTGSYIGVPQALGSGLPLTLHAAPLWLIGVLWPAEGGVLYYQLPAEDEERTARHADCVLYGNIFLKKEGFRANPDGEDEPGYEPLADVLDRIMDRTTVLMNNFASRELFPWLRTSSESSPQNIVGIVL